MINNNYKNQIENIISLINDKNFKKSVNDLGLIPVGSTEQWSFNTVLKSNKRIEQFIISNNLKVLQ